MRHTVSEFMSHPVLSIRDSATLEEAHQLMRRHRVRHLVVRSAGVLEGVVSQRDLYFVEALPGTDLKQVQVSEAMSQGVYTVQTDAPIWEVAEEMARRHVGCAVVLRGDDVEGIFTSTDALDTLAHVLSHPAVRRALPELPRRPARTPTPPPLEPDAHPTG